MKAKFTLLTFFVAAFFAANAQQIPNAGFETWTNPGNPDGWGTWETATGAPLGLATKDTVLKREGNASLKLKTDSVQAGPQKLLIPGMASLGAAVYSPPNINFFGIPFTFRPDTLFFSYRYAPVGSDTAWLELQISGTAGDLLAGGLPLTSTLGQWVDIFVPLTGDIAPGAVDSIRILFTSSLPSGFGIQGSVLNVDAIRVGYVALPNALQEVANKLNIAVYPNPVKDVIIISADQNTEGLRAVISDITGKIVSVNELSGQKTAINLSELSNGMYIYRIADKAGNIFKQNKFNVVK
ncbi:MAG: T9SS type A sorting domain-containing protein [Bacteroidota bacterium]